MTNTPQSERALRAATTWRPSLENARECSVPPRGSNRPNIRPNSDGPSSLRGRTGKRPTGVTRAVRFVESFKGTRAVAPETAELFADTERSIEEVLDRLDKALSGLDPTLRANLLTRRKKIVYHVDALKKKAFAAKLRKEQTIERQIRALFSTLLPNGELQERSINIHSYLSRYGSAFVDELYNAVDLEDRGHRVIHI